jgi:hypothetical protein
MRDLWDHVPDNLKHLVDLVSITTLLGTISQMLPHVAATLTIVWTVIRIYETKTVQRWLRQKGDA